MPRNAVAFSATAAALDSTSAGFLTIWPASSDLKLVSCLNYQPGIWTAGSIYSAVAQDGRFYMYAVSLARVFVDVSGYFAPAGSGYWYHK